jgi:hypothetical protein
MPNVSQIYDTDSGVWRDVVDTTARKNILYYTGVSVSSGTSTQIMRIPASGTNSDITTDTVVLNITFNNPSYITSGISWRSYAGYVTFTGTCTAVTSANVILGRKGN